ncbi:DUF1257 domain-containing protein [Cyanobacterium aponinum UTEX 3222]|uniref:DUF1257 domain-containing protein n=1 Tax=Cyanobacterium aponinum TaxID=379064 RepID=UPI0030914914|nr:DUF1257 domain-containing protein [Cyanobacterium aponinum UTEX 3222]
MSHFTRLKTKIVEKEYLKQSLIDLGYKYQEGNVQVNGYMENRTNAELKIFTNNPNYDIGFQKQKDNYEIVADWWGIKDIQQAQFVKTLNQKYAYHATKAKLEEQGFSLVSEEVEEGNQIHLVLRRMA